MVLSLSAQGSERRHLLDLGFTPGSVVQSIRRSPNGDPTAFRIRGATIALRTDQAKLITVRPLQADELGGASRPAMDR